MREKEYNQTFLILSVIGILLVVEGHIGDPVLTVDNLFPYYSFHIPLFLFISGYFYKKNAEEQTAAYIKRKVKNLLVPYFVWNVIYGIITMMLHRFGFGIGQNISFRTLFVEPFLGGHQYLYNFPAWFVPALFLVEMVNLCMRKVLTFLQLNNEYVIFTISLAIGITAIMLSKGGHVYDFYRSPGRIMFLLPCFQMGRFYKEKLEKHDTLSNGFYFLILLAIQLLIVMTSGGLAFSAVWCTSFANGPLVPYISSVTGIAFWLRLSRILVPVVGNNRFIAYLGKHTFSVMMHHVMAFMMLKGIFAWGSVKFGIWADFDWWSFQNTIDYFYLPEGREQIRLLYLFVGITIPLAIRAAQDQIIILIGRTDFYNRTGTIANEENS